MDNQTPAQNKPPTPKPDTTPTYRLERKFIGKRYAKDLITCLIRAHA